MRTRPTIAFCLILCALMFAGCSRDNPTPPPQTPPGPPPPPDPPPPPAPPSARQVTVIRNSGGRVDWSADNLIVFDRLGPDDFYDIAVMNPDGSGERCLTCDKTSLPNKHIGNPAWHPSGAFIAFQAQKAAAVSIFGNVFFAPGSGLANDLWIMDRDGNRFWQMTNVDLRGGGVLHPKFSHRGDRLMWSERISGRGIYGEWVIKVANFSVTADVPRIDNVVTLQPGVQKLFYETHGFTPDDSAIIFSGNLEAGLSEYAIDIYRMTLATGEVTNLTATTDQWDEHAHISPSGRHIVWMSSLETGRPTNPAQLRTDYWTMRSDGTSKTRLTFFNRPGHAHALPEGGIGGDLAWSPDGTRLVAYVIESSAPTVPPVVADRLIESRSTRIVIIDLEGVSGIDRDVPVHTSPAGAEGAAADAPGTREPEDGELMSLALPPSSAAPAAPAQARAPTTGMAVDSRALRTWDRDIDLRVRTGELRRIETVDDTLIPGRRHERFAQFERGVHVFGGGATRQTANGTSQSIFVAIDDAAAVDTNPRLTEFEAASALARVVTDIEVSTLQRPELVIAADDENDLHLAYHWRIVSDTRSRSYFIDAHAGDLVLAFDEAVERERMPGHLAAHLQEYFAERFKAVAPIGPVIDVAHPGIFGDRRTTLDRAAHHIAHNAIDTSSRLIARGEAGALAEAFADITAASAAAAFGDFDTRSSAALRAPAAFGRLDHYAARSAGGDSAYSRIRAGIAGHVFHLAVEGGTNQTSGAVVFGVGPARRAQIERAFYRAFTFLLPPNATFHLAKAATVQAAADLYGPDSDATRAIRGAWIAAGL